MREGHGGVVAGSHTGAWIQDILAEDNVMFMTDNGLRLEHAGHGRRRAAHRIPRQRHAGGRHQEQRVGRGQTFANNTNGSPFILTLSYSAGSNVFNNAAAAAQFRDITVNRVTIDNGNPAPAGR